MGNKFQGPSLGSVDMESRYRRRQAVQNIVTIANHAGPEARSEARHWYDRVNEATSKDIRGTSTDLRHGAGIVAAVSPNMDWERNNMSAIHELHSLKGAQWKQIEAGDRSPVQGMSMAAAATPALMKAKRIMDGEDPEDVLNRRTGPKVNSFFHNIAEPDVSGPVTIDGRAHDVAANRLQGWTDNSRNIKSAGLKTGKTTRYEHFENAYRSAANVLNEQHGENYLPHEVQAISWEHAKGLERQGTTKTGQPRKQGPSRVGQPYFGPNGLIPKP